jgi:hypothetical protein
MHTRTNNRLDIDPLQTREERQAAIKLSWGFQCTCPLCTLPESLSQASDRRISAITELESKLLSSFSRSKNTTAEETSQNREKETEIAELIISLYEQERVTAHIADAFRYAARAYKRAGKHWEALKWGYKAEESGLIYEGPESTKARMMRGLVWGEREALGLKDDEDEDGDEE